MINKVIHYLNLPNYLTKFVLSFFSANLIVIITQTISSLSIARMVLPHEMGFLTTASISMTFIPLLLLGVNNGLNRQIPFLIGQGKVDEVQDLRNTAFTWSISLALCIFVLITSVGIYFHVNNESKLALALYATAVSGSLFPIITTIEVNFRTSSDFVRLSKIKLYTSISAIATVPIVYFYGFHGLVFRTAFIAVFSISILYILKTIPLMVRFKTDSFLSLLRIGAPILFWSYLYTLYIGLDKILIVKYFTVKEMGLLTPTIQIVAGLSVLPNSIFQIIYPRLCQRYGEKGTIESMRKLVFTPLKYLSVGLIPLFGLAIWFVDPFIRMTLPNYVEGILTAQWAIVAVYFRSLGGGQDVFTVTGKLHYYGIITVISALVFYLMFHFFLNIGWGLESVTASYAISVLVFNLFVTLVIQYWLMKERIGNGLV